MQDFELYPSFFQHADKTFLRLKQDLLWSKPSIQIFGKTIPIPREQAFYGDPGVSYKYSRTIFNALNWDPHLYELKQKIELHLKAKFNCVLCNKYSNGDDYMSLHSDDEPELGAKPIIASCSFGATRTFQIQRKDKSFKKEIELSDGDLLVMMGDFQQLWNHGIKKTKKPVGPRINLTFRNIIK